MTTESLKGQVALVTGGGRGIGKVIAEAFAAQGAAVAVLGRSQSSLEQTVEKITAAGGVAMARSCDVANAGDIAHAVAEIKDAYGPPNILINNAGIGGASGPLWQCDPDEWWSVMEVNLKGPFLMMHAVLQDMVTAGRGCVINVGSYVGVNPTGWASAYSTSKAALMRLSDCAADSLDDSGVSVFTISPGFVWTDMTKELDSKIRESDPEYEGMDEAWIFPAEDAAKLCLRLAAGDADRLSGRMIHVRDDLDALIERADEIIDQDGYALRLTMALDDL